VGYPEPESFLSADWRSSLIKKTFKLLTQESRCVPLKERESKADHVHEVEKHLGYLAVKI